MTSIPAYAKLWDMKFYHLSGQDLGGEVVLTPRRPRGPAVGEDATTERVSVGRDIEDCVLSITWAKANGRTFYVYELDADEQGVEVEDAPWSAVPDAGDTRECWLLEPATFRRVGYVQVSNQDPWDWPNDGPLFTRYVD